MSDTTAQTTHQTAGGAEPSRTSTEVLEKPERRTFTADDKQRILAEAR